MKRLFSGPQKKHLYLVSGGRCEMCGSVLGLKWDAHHVRRHADGGATEIYNAQALCLPCHRLHHQEDAVSTIDLRKWQKAALNRFAEHDEKCFLLEATPGAGKTLFSGACALTLLKRKEVDFVVVVVPTTALKGDRESGFFGGWNEVGLQLETNIKAKNGPPQDKSVIGVVITYQQLSSIVSTIETWADNGKLIFVVFDEVHHLTEDNIWGGAADRLARKSVRMLAMTGTPFRGDGERISFIDYDADDKALAHYRYRYGQAVTELVCRPVEFITDGGKAEFIRGDERQEVVISEVTEFNIGDTAATIFRHDSDWLESVIRKADDALSDYRLWDHDAGGLIVCRPGGDEWDDRHLRQVAGTVKRLTGEEPVVISHDDPEANIKIERFRNSTARWILSVRKISEGVDIKRLRVEVMATRPTTELLFRQIVGRVVRVDKCDPDAKKPRHSTIFIAKFPQLEEWAQRLREEAQVAVRDRDDLGRQDSDRDDNEPNERSKFVPLGSTHEDGGAISDFGEKFSAAEISAAERHKIKDPVLTDLPVTMLAHIRRSLNVKEDPLPEEPRQEPLHFRKKDLRKKISIAARQLAIRRDPDEPDYPRVYRELHAEFGTFDMNDLANNHSIEVMQGALDRIYKWLGDR